MYYVMNVLNHPLQELVARMSAFTDDSDSWATKVRKSAMNEVDLTARYSSRPIADGAPAYFVYGAALCEVEVDILTGEKNIRNRSIMMSAKIHHSLSHSHSQLISSG